MGVGVGAWCSFSGSSSLLLLGELFSVTDGDTEGPGGEGSLSPAHPLPPSGKISDPSPFSMNRSPSPWGWWMSPWGCLNPGH